MPPFADQPPPKKRHSGIERALLLRDAVTHAVRAEQETARPHARRQSRGGRMAVVALCAGLVAFCAWSFVQRPEFIWGPRAPAVPAERVEANVRMSMYLVARRAELQRAAHGDYPNALAEFSPDTALRYRASGEEFEITGVANGRLLVLRSSDDLGAFLGNSADLIQQRVRR